MKLTDQCPDILNYLLYFLDDRSHILLGKTCRQLYKLCDFLPYVHKVGGEIYVYDNIFNSRFPWSKTKLLNIRDNRREVQIILRDFFSNPVNGWIRVKDIQITTYRSYKINPKTIKANDLIDVNEGRYHQTWTQYRVAHNNHNRKKLAVRSLNSWAYADKSIDYNAKIVRGGTYTSTHWGIPNDILNYQGDNALCDGSKTFYPKGMTSVDLSNTEFKIINADDDHIILSQYTKDDPSKIMVKSYKDPILKKLNAYTENIKHLQKQIYNIVVSIQEDTVYEPEKYGDKLTRYNFDIGDLKRKIHELSRPKKIIYTYKVTHTRKTFTLYKNIKYEDDMFDRFIMWGDDIKEEVPVEPLKVDEVVFVEEHNDRVFDIHFT